MERIPTHIQEKVQLETKIFLSEGTISVMER